jgi:hypothetical protein
MFEMFRRGAARESDPNLPMLSVCFALGLLGTVSAYVLTLDIPVVGPLDGASTLVYDTDPGRLERMDRVTIDQAPHRAGAPRRSVTPSLARTR